MKKNMLRRSVGWLCLCWMISAFSVLAATPAKIPPELESWQEWVLFGQEERLCPTAYHNGASYHCAWPSALTLRVTSQQGQFEQKWLIFKDSWVPLPGEPGSWPESVQLNGERLPVIARHDAPYIFLPTGSHTLSGEFRWDEMPEMLMIPPASGLIKLWIDQAPVPHPVFEKNGRLWLQKRVAPETEEDRQEVRIFRLIEDSIPMHIVTHLNLTISGQVREIRLSQILLPDSVPLRLESTLPARLNHDGELMLQARPGKWSLRLTAYFAAPMYALGPALGQYGQEIWAFSAMTPLRVTELSGVPSVEPSRTELPREWQGYPAFIIEPGATLKIEEIRRGDPDPAPDRLSLERTFWLDFEGTGLTIRDQITGSLSRKWHLAMNPSGTLGRVMVDDQDCLITYPLGDDKPGVELRRSQIRLTADSRYEHSITTIPAVGWDHDFQSLSATLNLPPGWRLFTAAGVDILPGTWFQRWTLLDLFMVLIIGIAIYKLRNPWWGAIALVTMTLIYHESNAPRLVFLHIVIALGLLQVLPPGWIRRLVRFWGILAVIFLLTVSIPFFVQHLRHGLYPQLEAPGQYYNTSVFPLGCGQMYRQEAPSVFSSADSMKTITRYRQTDAETALQPPEDRWKSLYQYEPDALIQTGPGLPNWSWRAMQMKWNGPVDRTHEIRLWLMPPGLNLALAFIRVGLLSLLIFGLIAHGFLSESKAKIKDASVSLICAGLIWAGLAVEASAAAYPPPEILNQMRERLLASPDCLPYCADVERLQLDLTADRLQIRLEIHAAQETAVPLPASPDSWTPTAILLDNQPADGLLRDAQGLLWALVPAGIHTILMDGRPGPEPTIRIPVPIKPHFAAAKVEGWDLTGISRKGKIESGLQLMRRKTDGDPAAAYSASTIAPFFRLKREIHLGLTWHIVTSVERVTTDAVPVMLKVPLLPGESVADAAVSMENNQALVNMDAGVNRLSWLSTLPPTTEFELRAPTTAPWSETWILDISPVWHGEFSGIAVIHHQDDQGVWRPEWRPWPGESVKVTISRPQPLIGKVFTIDSARLNWVPGKRFNKAQLTLNLRTSRGGNHELTIPAQAKPQVLKINDKIEPIRQDGQKIMLSLPPQASTVFLEWNQPTSFSFILKAPEIHLGGAAVNTQVHFEIPRNLWILWVSGPTLGPAVLFWSYLLVAILAAIGLGKTTFTPLKFRHWLLLNLGLTQIPPIIALVVIGWFLILAWRKTQDQPERRALAFNVTQLLLMVWTAAAGFGLFYAIETGLLGIPYMQIAGNGSYDAHLAWTMDRIDGNMPRPWAVALPMLSYRLLMLFWALWLAISLLKWVRWAWECFSAGGVWKKRPKKTTPPQLPT